MLIQQSTANGKIELLNAGSAELKTKLRAVHSLISTPEFFNLICDKYSEEKAEEILNALANAELLDSELFDQANPSPSP